MITHRVVATTVVMLALVSAARAEAHCDDAIDAAVAPADHPASELVQGVWARVYGSFAALTGRATELVVLAPEAKQKDGKPFPPSAFICPSKSAADTPKLYVTWPLIERAQADKLYDVDFVALVIGHELGHRARDLTFEGVKDPRPTLTGPAVEARADAHAAFFAAIAGYSTRRLACDAALDTFLDVEAHVAEGARVERRKQLALALAAFDVYESLYESSAGLAFWDSKQARALLGWVDQRLGRDFTPIPEFKVLLALTILMDVAGESPWTNLVAVPGAPNDHLRCVPVFPQHTALWDEVLAMDGQGATQRDAGSDLKAAVALLNEALGLGASPLAAQSALSCAHAYLGDAKKARAALEQARVAATGRPQALQAALAANGAFIDWIDWMRASKPPKPSDDDKTKKTWADGLRKARPGFVAHPGVIAWIDSLKSYPTPPPPASPTPLACKVEPPKSSLAIGWSRLPTCPDAPRAGGCPCGWLELHHLDDPLTPDASDGVRTCVPGGWGTGLRWVDVNLPLPDVRARLMLVDTLGTEGALASLRTWEKRCQAFEPRGTSDRGLTVYAGVCPDLGAPQVILQADDCRVQRAIVIGP